MSIRKKNRAQRPEGAKSERLVATTKQTLPEWAGWLIVVIGSGTVSLYLLEANTRASWWFQDDHQIVRYLGSDGKMTIGEFPRLLASTEVGEWGQRNQRFRPSYYALRLIETWLWGASPQRWYVARIVMLAISLALCWRVLGWWIGLAPAALVLLYCLWLPFWGDIWCRLGPGETYCVPGLALYAFGALGIVRTVRRSSLVDAPTPGHDSIHRKIPLRYWFALTIGALIAMGAKENFLLLLLPTWALAVWLVAKRGLRATNLGWIGAITAYGLFVGIVVALAVGQSGHDQYLRAVSASSRLGLIGPGFVQAFSKVDWRAAGAAALTLGIGLFLLRRHFRALLPSLIRTTVILVCLLLVYVSQFVFYNGEWPGETRRYHFPGALAGPACWVVLGCLGLDILQVAKARSITRHLICTGAAALMVIPVLVSCPSPLVAQAQRNEVRTRAFTKYITHLARTLAQHPERPLVFVSHARRDTEPSVAFVAFLRAYGATNDFFLRLNWRKRPETMTRFERRIFEIMMIRSKDGKNGFKPLQELRNVPRPFAVGLSGDPVGPYVALNRFW